jgi:hypothetical protein
MVAMSGIVMSGDFDGASRPSAVPLMGISGVLILGFGLAKGLLRKIVMRCTLARYLLIVDLESVTGCWTKRVPEINVPGRGVNDQIISSPAQGSNGCLTRTNT